MFAPSSSLSSSLLSSSSPTKTTKTTKEEPHPSAKLAESTKSDPESEPIRLFHAGYYHNLAVGFNTGSLYSWGCGTFTDGGMDGVIPALGITAKAAAEAAPTPAPLIDIDIIREDRGGTPEIVPIPKAQNNTNINIDPIVDITGGAYHSVVLQQSGTVLTFGAAQLGQLGRSTMLTDQSGLPVDPYPRPAEVDFGLDVSLPVLGKVDGKSKNIVDGTSDDASNTGTTRSSSTSNRKWIL